MGFLKKIKSIDSLCKINGGRRRAAREVGNFVRDYIIGRELITLVKFIEQLKKLIKLKQGKILQK